MAVKEGTAALLLDARTMTSVQSVADIGRSLGLKGSVFAAVGRAGRCKGHCRFIIDQLDSVAGQHTASLLSALAQECATLRNVQVVVITRKREACELDLFRELTSAGFQEMVSHPQNQEVVEGVFQRIGIRDPSVELVKLAMNLLFLELIASIREESPSQDLSVVLDDIDLWEMYMKVLLDKEKVGSSHHAAETVVAEAVSLARKGLNGLAGTFCLDFPPSPAQRRLISWGLVEMATTRVGRFRHDEFLFYIFAWDATERALMPDSVLGEIIAHRSRNVLLWMNKIYERRHPHLHLRFLKAMLNE